MKVDELLTNEVIERFRLLEETKEEREALISIAAKVLGRTITYTCRNCYFDTLVELINLYKTNQKLFNERMKEKRYQIARGVCMPLGFGSDRMIVYQNCTDELAIEFLSLDENNSKHFERLPDNWKEEVAEYFEKKSGKEIIPVEYTPAELEAIAKMKQLLSEGSTKKAVKDSFMTLGSIGEVKVTHRRVDSLLKEASEQFEVEKVKNTTDLDSDNKKGDSDKVEDVVDPDSSSNGEQKDGVNLDQTKVD